MMKYNTCNNPLVLRNQERKTGYGNCNVAYTAWSKVAASGTRHSTPKWLNGDSPTFLASLAFTSAKLTQELWLLLFMSMTIWQSPIPKMRMSTSRTKCARCGPFPIWELLTLSWVLQWLGTGQLALSHFHRQLSLIKSLSNSARKMPTWHLLPSSLDLNFVMLIMIPFSLTNSFSSIYWSLVGCLLYLAISTCPDISHAVQQLSQYLNSYSFDHWKAALQLVHYLKGTWDLKLHLRGNFPIKLHAFSNSDWANCDTHQSVGGYICSLGSGAISWAAQKQKVIAASSCEAKYIAALEATKECIWLCTLLDAILATVRPLLRQFPVTTLQPRPFPKTPFCIPTWSISISNTTSFMSVYNPLTYALTMLTPNTMLPTCSWKPWTLSVSPIFEISWAWNDQLHARRSDHSEEECWESHHDHRVITNGPCVWCVCYT